MIESIEDLDEYEIEILKTNNLMNQLTRFLIKCNLDYSLETWDNGEGRDIILNGRDEDLKEYKISFAFKNNGYVTIDVEPNEEPEPLNDGGNEDEK